MTKEEIRHIIERLERVEGYDPNPSLPEKASEVELYLQAQHLKGRWAMAGVFPKPPTATVA